MTEDRKRVKVADFGLAREEVMDGMTSEAGTYRWMAPKVLLYFCFITLIISCCHTGMFKGWTQFDPWP